MADSNCPLSIKKAKLDADVVESEKSVHEDLKDLSAFAVDKVLFNNSNRKTVCLQGTFKNSDGVGIVLLEKAAFEEDALNGEGLLNNSSVLEQHFHNDIYGNYDFFPSSKLSVIKANIIHPATQKHIDKYTTHTAHIVDETPEIYRDIVLPHLNKEQFNLKWVYNILERKSEVDRIVYEDVDEINGFTLVPDFKWDGKTQETLYLLALVRRRDVKSLRDLTHEHLTLLKNIKDCGSKAIQEKYGLDSTRLRIYVHYQPSFYHLHVHFTYLQHDAPGTNGERAHMLSTVINNIELNPDYYQKATIPFVVYENNNLFGKLETAGLVAKQNGANV